MTLATPVWAAVAAADRVGAADRAALADRWRASSDGRPDQALIVTCHRVELYGLGEPIEAAGVTAGAGEAAQLLAGFDAARHLGRLAAGLESAVVGEDQILHQVRTTLGELTARSADARLVRLFELSVRAGRRARAGRAAVNMDLGEIAITWLATRTGPLAGRRVLIVGAGETGELLAAAAHRRGAELIVASRTIGRARALASQFGAQAVDLGAAATTPGLSAAAIALSGPWVDLAATGDGIPTVDLSFPSALSSTARHNLGDRFADVDRIYREAQSLAGGPDAYIAAAEPLVDDAVDAYVRWSAGRGSVQALRRLREKAEKRRRNELERLLRRLPDLDPRERDVVEAFSERLIAGLLHEPSVALREDLDGSAATAAGRLFRL